MISMVEDTEQMLFKESAAVVQDLKGCKVTNPCLSARAMEVVVGGEGGRAQNFWPPPP